MPARSASPSSRGASQRPSALLRASSRCTRWPLSMRYRRIAMPAPGQPLAVSRMWVVSRPMDSCRQRVQGEDGGGCGGACHVEGPRDVEPLSRLRYASSMMTSTSTAPAFQLNGRRFDLVGSDPAESLLRWLKRQRLNGTKEGCGDGDCGACTVVLVETDADGRSHYRAVNSCLLPMGSVVGREIVTVEALADGDTLHPVQQALVEHSGSQCGYCTPGFVMSLFAGGYSGELNDHTTEGNLCRCTGYAPIRRATADLVTLDFGEDRFADSLRQPREPAGEAALGDYFSPITVEDALALKQEHPDAAWIAGATDLGVDLSRGRPVAPAFIALDRIAGLQVIERHDDGWRIGAGVPLSRLESELGEAVPALGEMLRWFAARQVRNRATVGGNLGSASPIGDLSPLLMALDASIELRGANGTRQVAVADF